MRANWNEAQKARFNQFNPVMQQLVREEMAAEWLKSNRGVLVNILIKLLRAAK